MKMYKGILWLWFSLLLEWVHPEPRIPQGPHKPSSYSITWARRGKNIVPLEFSDSDGNTGHTILSEVTEFGMQETIFLKEVREPELFQKGLSLKNGHPGLYLAAFNKQKAKTRDLASFGYASLRASEMLSKQFLLTRAQATFGLEQVDLHNTSLYENCPFKADTQIKPSCPKFALRYRTLDGTCNNLEHPERGSAFKAFSRFLPPDYSDGLEQLRQSVSGRPLPNPRKVSAVVHRALNRQSEIVTQMIMQWGQFLDHDLTSTAQPRGFNHSVPKCCNEQTGKPLPKEFRHPDCLPIEIPDDDPFFSRWSHTCMEFLRSSPAPRPNCALGPRDQINQVTSFLDASNVYGSDDREMAELRLWDAGMLNYKPVRFRKPLLPALNEFLEGECRENSKNLHCFRAGDLRVNEHPGLASMHTLWLREHNRLVGLLSELNPQWNDNKIYFESRRIVAAQMQKITYGEWLPIVLGSEVMRIFRLPLQRLGYYRGYNSSVNPTVTNSFGAAVFRFGHSLVQESLSRCDKSGRKVPFSIRLHSELMNPANIHNFGSVDRLLLGFVNTNSQERDVFITEELTQHLFQSPGHPHGMDLAAINIQRGRDHGLPAYNIWREQCGLRRFNNWGELLHYDVVDEDTVGRLAVVYESIDDVDLFTGGLAEKPVKKGMVGPTFACILGQQFLNLRRGDRFWFENGAASSAFTPEQLQQIRKISLARVLCDNLDDIDEIQPNVFRPPRGKRNVRVSCTKIPEMDLSPWKEPYSFVQTASPSPQQEDDKLTAHYSGPLSFNFDEAIFSHLSEEELFFLDYEKDYQELDDSNVQYSRELPRPFEDLEGKSAKTEHYPHIQEMSAKISPSWFSEAQVLDFTNHNFNSVAKEAYTDTLFYKKIKKK